VLDLTVLDLTGLDLTVLDLTGLDPGPASAEPAAVSGRALCPDQRRLPAVRSYRDLWVWLGGLFLTLFAFFTAVAIAYFAKQANYSLFLNGWMLGALLTFLAAFTCFYAAMRAWAFPPGAKPAFPSIEVEIFGTGSIDTQREGGSGLAVPAHLQTFSSRFAHTGTEGTASLTVLLYVKLIPGSWGRVGEAVCPPPDWTLTPSLSLTPISMPFELAPGNATDGHLVYEVPSYYLDKIAEPLRARLELWDHVTGKRMSMPAEIGSHDTSRMVPSSGSAEVLGPEYASQADQPGAASQAPGEP
jgi:hypothetical protein